MKKKIICLLFGHNWSNPNVIGLLYPFKDKICFRCYKRKIWSDFDDRERSGRVGR